MTFTFPKSGLYAITETKNFPQDRLYKITEAVLTGGARALQFRDKTHDDCWRHQTGRRLLQICHEFGVPLVINDDIALAHEIGADGVHLGEDDGSLEEARKILGPNAIIGVSCYASLERAHSAESKYATYIAFGRFFPSGTKPGALAADPNILNFREFRVPVVAIGGITLKNGQLLLEAGADLLAVIGDLFAHPDPEQSARALQELFR